MDMRQAQKCKSEVLLMCQESSLTNQRKSVHIKKSPLPEYKSHNAIVLGHITHKQN